MSNFSVARRHPHHRLPRRAQPRGQRRRRLQRADGTRCADTGPHAAHRDRLLPRLGVAAGVDPAATGFGGPIRVGVPGAADAPMSRRSTARRGPRPTSPICTPGPRCTSRARAGSASTRPRVCSPARATFRCRRRRIRSRRPRSPDATEPCETTLEFSNVVTRVHEDPRVTLPYTDAAWAADQRARRAGRRAAGRRRRPADRRRRADVRLDRQPGRPGMDDRRRRSAQARARLGAGGAAEEDLGSPRPGAAQPGQVVSRRTVAALADRAVLAHRRRAAVDR